jgi:predicted restriction endonuclease
MTTGEESINMNLAYYRQRFVALNVSNTRQRGKANNKPILLLSIIDLIAQGVIRENRIYVFDNLIKTFNKYWDILGSESHNRGLYYPFWHLEGDGFWHKTLKSGFNGSKPKTTHKLKEAVEIVDGSHIKPFSKFYDDQINNGISLCKNHHWAFDQGWFAIDDNYKIIVANDLEEESPNARTMKDFQGEAILLPNSDQDLPRLESLEWHRVNVFRA